MSWSAGMHQFPCYFGNNDISAVFLTASIKPSHGISKSEHLWAGIYSSPSCKRGGKSGDLAPAAGHSGMQH
jgi:hypothetical protein